MKTQISRRDWQRLSAFVDGQLSSRKYDRLAARLEQEPALQAALEDLQVMKQKLQELPKVRAPRNFTLTPEMVGQRRRAVRRYNSMRLASALASILLVLVFVGVNVSYGNLALAPAPAMQRSVDDLEAFAEMAEPQAPAADAVVAESEVGKIKAEGTEAEGTEAEPDDAEEKAEEGLNAAEYDAADEEAALEARQEAAEGVEAGIPRQGPVSMRPVIILQIALALTAVISGLLAFRLRRR